MEKKEFEDLVKMRSQDLAVEIVKWYDQVKKTDSIRILGKQLVRSSTSVASNYRAACVARSRKEFFSKISIVVEEADESVFWLEMIERSQKIEENQFRKFKREALELAKIVTKARNSMYN